MFNCLSIPRASRLTEDKNFLIVSLYFMFFVRYRLHYLPRS